MEFDEFEEIIAYVLIRLSVTSIHLTKNSKTIAPPALKQEKEEIEIHPWSKQPNTICKTRVE